MEILKGSMRKSFIGIQGKHSSEIRIGQNEQTKKGRFRASLF